MRTLRGRSRHALKLPLAGRGAAGDHASAFITRARHTARWYTWAMPTTLHRTQITHVPRVQRILDAGAHRYPGASPAAILINLAEERVNELPSPNPEAPKKRNGLTLLPPGEGTVTMQMVLDVLHED